MSARSWFPLLLALGLALLPAELQAGAARVATPGADGPCGEALETCCCGPVETAPVDGSRARPQAGGCPCATPVPPRPTTPVAPATSADTLRLELPADRPTCLAYPKASRAAPRVRPAESPPPALRVRDALGVRLL